MTTTAENNKRIAKNTLMLYVRMIFVTLVSLFTTRIILKALGVDDYGLYNVIGGVVALLGMLNSSVTAATQRYLSFDLGKNDIQSLKQDFSACLNIYIGLALVIIIFSETIGLWFVNSQLNIPDNRLVAANFVYQFTIFSSVLSLLWSPYNASLISHERMDVFAWISIVEVTLKLALTYSVLYINYDRLIIYGFFIFLSYVIVGSCYLLYSRIHFEECRFRWFFDKGVYKNLLDYSGWNLFGTSAGLIANQGVNILLNIFFSSAVNAARGIAYQISGIISQLFGNFYTAVKPQVTKYYAGNSIPEMYNLILSSARFMYYLALWIAIPVFFELPYIVHLWLGQTPDYLLTFASLTIICCVLDSFSNPLMSAALASDKIRGYQVVVSLINFMTFPMAFICIKIFNTPTVVFIVAIFISIAANIGRAYYAQKLVGLKMRIFFNKVILRILIPTILAPIIPYFITHLFSQSFIRACSTFFISLIASSLIIYFTGTSKQEKQLILSYAKKAISKVTRYA
jgi:O-antigen/teichoic acid export membrane protein